MSTEVNKSLQNAMAEQGITPVSPSNDSPLIPSSPGQVKSVDGLPGIKDKTSQPQQQPQQQQTAPQQQQEPQMVPLAAAKEERQKRQEAEHNLQKINQKNGELEQRLATMQGQLQNMQEFVNNNAVQQNQTQQQQVMETPPDIMLEPDNWTGWMLDKVDQVVVQRVQAIVSEIVQGAFAQRMAYFDKKNKERYGPELIARATNFVVDKGLRDQAIQNFDPVEWSVEYYHQQQGINHFAADHTGRLDPKVYNERLLGQVLQTPQFWNYVATQPQYQNAFTQAFTNSQQQPQGQQPQGQQPQQQPQQFQQPAPQQQQPLQIQQPNLPPSMMGAPGAGANSFAPLPPVNDDLKSALNFGAGQVANGRAA